jgi:hypothetical protein
MGVALTEACLDFLKSSDFFSLWLVLKLAVVFESLMFEDLALTDVKRW